MISKLHLRSGFALALLVAIVSSTGCSIKKIAISKLGDSLASQSTSSFASDEDPELVGDALPFALKLMEGLLDQVPNHRGLLCATSSGFTQYTLHPKKFNSLIGMINGATLYKRC